MSTLAVPSLFGRFTHAAIDSTLGPDQYVRVPALPSHPDAPERPRLIVERFIAIAASPDSIFGLLANAERWPNWDPTIGYAETELHHPLKSGDSFSREENGTESSGVVLEAERGRLLRWRSNGRGRVVGVHSFRLVPIDSRRTLVVERKEFSHWLLRFFAWTSDFGIGNQLERTLRALKLAAEASAT